MPFGGYRFGGDFFELAAEHRLDEDGAPAAGFVVNVPGAIGRASARSARDPSERTGDDSQPAHSLRARARVRRSDTSNQGGGLQEFSGGRNAGPSPPECSASTRYAADGNSEVRLTVGAGGGVKLFPLSHLGLRLDGRVYTTFVDADMTFLACAPGRCAAALHVTTVWQARVHRPESSSDFPDGAGSVGRRECFETRSNATCSRNNICGWP